MIVSAQEIASNQYDYLIVGGGTAGLVLANRLSEDPGIRVAVIEAGDWIQDDPNINTPGYYGRSLANPQLNWGFQTTPQTALNDRVCGAARGKGLGGSSTVNFMLCGRGSSEEYDFWSSEYSFTGWDWDSLLPYFVKAETLTAPRTKILQDGKVKPLVGKRVCDSLENTNVKEQPEWNIHGQNGPVTQTYPLWSEDELSLKFLQTCEGLGLEINTDPANGKNIGAFIPPVAVDPLTGNRVSSSTAYYAPIHSTRPNLHVCLKSQACKITFTDDVEKESDGKSVTASGVEFTSEGNIYQVKSKNEVILCGGSYQTPQLLELSGIGATKYTQDLGIKQRVNLPGVGENLEDHLMVPSIFEIDPSFATQDAIYSEEELKRHIELFKKQDGVLTVPPGLALCILPFDNPLNDRLNTERIRTALNSAKSKLQNESDERPEVQKRYQMFQKWLDLPNQGILEYMLVPKHIGRPGKPGHAYISISAVLLHSLSRGSTHIASADPLNPPIIDPRYCSQEIDLLLLMEGAKGCRKLANSEPLRSIVKNNVFPPTESDGNHDTDWERFVKENVGTTWHPCSTCTVGKREEGAVVDSELRVFGTTNLRIVDASVLPTLPSHHPQMTIYALAEKAADVIKYKDMERM